MSDEIDGPSPEDMGLNPSYEDATDSERLGNIFQGQLLRQLSGGEQEVTDLDKSKYYANITQIPRGYEDGRGKRQTRLYGIYHPNEEVRYHESGTGFFDMQSRAEIETGWRYDPASVRFTKYGRNSVGHLNPNWEDMVDPTVHRESETLGYRQDYSDKYAEGRFGYSYYNIKGSEVGFYVGFDMNGDLKGLGATHPQGEQEESYNYEAIQEIKTSVQSDGKLSFSQPDGKYHFVLANKKGEKQYIIKIPESMDVYRVEDETEVRQFLDDPNRPPEADDIWRSANFTQLLGIEIEPAQDIEVE